MKNKKIFIVLVLLTIVFIGASQASAADIIFKPSVDIPGAGEMPGGFASGTEYKISGDSISQYIYLIYVYGSRFAAILAMFMLVIAGWQWVMAGGVPERINRSKDIIVGVFVGLALLFGGNVLMSQISQRLVNFNTLKIDPIGSTQMTDQACQMMESMLIGNPNINYNAQCGQVLSSDMQKYLDPDFLKNNKVVLDSVMCISSRCEEGYACVLRSGKADCPLSIDLHAQHNPDCLCVPEECSAMDFNPIFGENGCPGYQTDDTCRLNSCLGKQDKYGRTMNQTCGVNRMGNCVEITNVPCSSNADCDYDNSDTYCCEESFDTDFCRVSSEIDNCMNN